MSEKDGIKFWNWSLGWIFLLSGSKIGSRGCLRAKFAQNEGRCEPKSGQNHDFRCFFKSFPKPPIFRPRMVFGRIFDQNTTFLRPTWSKFCTWHDHSANLKTALARYRGDFWSKMDIFDHFSKVAPNHPYFAPGWFLGVFLTKIPHFYAPHGQNFVRDTTTRPNLKGI